MKRIVFTLLCAVFTASGIAQTINKDSTNCGFLTNVSFKNGVDTLEFDVFYWAFTPGNQEHPLELLAKENKFLLSEYIDKNFEGSTLEFIPLTCHRKYQSALSRKIYDHTYTIKSKNIEDYNHLYVNLNDLKTFQKLHIKCVVYEDMAIRNKHGGYFFTIIDLVPI